MGKERANKKIRGLLLENDMIQLDLCLVLACGESYITERMTGKKPWSQDDMYRIMDHFRVSYERMHELFPPRERTEKVRYKKKTTSQRRATG